MRKILMAIIILLLLISCGQPGNLPVTVIKSNTSKGVYYMDYTIEKYRPYEMVCYVDTAKYNPLNALDYTLKNSGVQFFDYVVLGGAYLENDEKGYYLGYTDDLLAVLNRKNTLLVPLQEVGIKVLLGVQSRPTISLGHPNEDEMKKVATNIYSAMRDFELDGVEFFDSADPSVQPPTRYAAAYDPDVIPPEYDYIGIEKSEWNEERWLLEEWKRGGSTMNNFPFTIRQMYDETIRENIVVLWREAGYGKYLPDIVRATAGIADFIGSGSQITYSFNIDSTVFKESSEQRYSQPQYENGVPVTWLGENQYGPLFIELDGGGTRNIWYPQLLTANVPGSVRGEEIQRFISRFKDPQAGSTKRFNEYQAIYFSNLKPVSEMKTDPFYKNLRYNESSPEADQHDFVTYGEEAWDTSKAIPAEYIFSTVAGLLLGEIVVNSGGDHQKDW